MMVLDVNLLIYAVNEDSPLDKKAQTWLRATLSGTESVGLPWIILLASLTLTTRAGVFQKPRPVRAALDLVETWLIKPTRRSLSLAYRAAHSSPAGSVVAPGHRWKSHVRRSSGGIG